MQYVRYLRLGHSAFAILVASIPAGTDGVKPAQARRNRDVREALTARFPHDHPTTRPAQHTIATEYFAPDAEVERITVRALAKALPNVEFFITRLRTAHFEYPNVETAVAVFEGTKPLRIATCLSPLYRTDPSFMEVLKGAKAESAAEQRSLGIDVGRLFAAITNRGHVRTPQLADNRFTAELWHGQMLWRQIIVEFNDGQVVAVSLVNPRRPTSQPTTKSAP